MTDDLANGPSCPFCATLWTDAMIEEFERFSQSGGCSCCSGQEVSLALPQPTRDLACEACGKSIYRKS